VCADQARAFGRSGPGSTNAARELSEVTSCIPGPGEPVRAGLHKLRARVFGDEDHRGAGRGGMQGLSPLRGAGVRRVLDESGG
jgi:hypothetical protein